MDYSYILDEIKPSEKEQKKVENLTRIFIERLNHQLVAAQATIGGSFAKNTWLKDDYDIDIFVLFNKRYDPETISETLRKKLRNAFLWKSLFFGIKKIPASRNYYQMNINNYKFEIVPVLNIKTPEEAKNIMDVSPLHVNWVNSNVKSKNLGDEIRLTKEFCKACSCYGAESYIKGFSGYVLEILTIYYGSFEELVKHAISWKPQQVIDTKNRKVVRLNESKLSPLIVIDPLQKERNACAALSTEKFELFKETCKRYLKFIKPKHIDTEKVYNEFFVKKLKIPKNALTLIVKPKKGRDDIVGTKLLKAFEFLKSNLKEFEIKEANWDWNKKENKAYFWFVVKKGNIAEYEKHFGPPITEEEHVKKFKEKWNSNEFFTENKKIYVKLKRKHTEFQDYLNALLKSPSLKDKLKDIKFT
ncbi:MAG: CCA tRNA nucleotidyltransferase [Candidatus Nanoarchaeia archaeon]|nr:CCA tRNA nucleotidyltransferase [Candidatus Nanoarchaeia archaeon]MDD5587484.1 CCA tRNA nucleotidyltransferase [Candidatus Nanoarchaeia archaeon]